MIYDDKKFIGKVIKNARKKARLSQAELSEKIEMSDKNLGNIENGKQFPQVNNFLKTIEVLNLSLEDFGVNVQKRLIDEKKEELIKKIIEADEIHLKGYKSALELVENILG